MEKIYFKITLKWKKKKVTKYKIYADKEAGICNRNTGIGGRRLLLLCDSACPT